MSHYEHKRGRLVLLEREENEDTKEYFKRVLQNKFDEEEWNDSDGNIYEFISMSDLGEEFFYAKEQLYKAFDVEDVDPYDDLQILKEDPRGGYWFEMKYYNGGTCLSEMVEEALEKL
jgi:hypothetical protein